MKSNRKIIVYIATSADGYIARPDGDVGWLNRPRPAGNYGMDTFFRAIDTILWGRKTYDFALGMGGVGLYGTKVKHYVFSKHAARKQSQNVEFISGRIVEFASRLRAAPGKNIWMMGGSGLIASFLDAREIDEFMIHVIPVFIGEGIPLIEPRHCLIQLDLLSSKRYPDGVVRLHYRVKRGRKS